MHRYEPDGEHMPPTVPYLQTTRGAHAPTLACRLRIGLGILLTGKYQGSLRLLQSVLPLRGTPVANRILALSAAWALGNGLAVAAATALLVALGSLFTGLPVSPAPQLAVL